MTKEVKNYDALKLKNQLCFPIYLCSKELIKKYTDVLNELNLTYTQYIVMMYFWEKKESNLTELGKALLLDSSTLTPLLKKLEQKGYISRKRAVDDERNLIISITSKGNILKEKAINIPKMISQELDLNEEEITTLYTLLYKLLFGLERK